MTTLTVTEIPTRYAARVQIAALTGTGPWTLIRSDPRGRATVIGGQNITGPDVIEDCEVCLECETTWLVIDSTGAETASAVTTISPPTSPGMDNRPCPVVSNPAAGIAFPVVLLREGMGEERPGAATLVEIEGTEVPAIIWDVERAARFSPQIITETADAETLLDDALRDGAPLLLRTPCPGVEDRWFHRVEGRNTDRIGQRPDNPARLTQLGKAVRLPGPYDPEAAIAGDTLGDLDDAVGHTTLGDIAAQWDTLGEIAATDLRAI